MNDELKETWVYFGRTSGGGEVYEVYRIPNNGKPFIEQDREKYPERMCRDGLWRVFPDDSALWNEHFTGDFSESIDTLSEQAVKQILDKWSKSEWPGRD